MSTYFTDGQLKEKIEEKLSDIFEIKKTGEFIAVSSSSESGSQSSSDSSSDSSSESNSNSATEINSNNSKSSKSNMPLSF